MKLIKWLGWIFLPYIMLPIEWRKLGRTGRILGSTWVVLILLAIVNANPKPKQSSEPVTSSSHIPNSDLKAEDKKVLEDLKKYMFENFGGNGKKESMVSWYEPITDFNLIKHEQNVYDVVINTSLYPKDSNKEIAKSMARAIFGFSNKNDNMVKILGVTINDKDGSMLEYVSNPIK
jgi:hypothetical protein